MLINLLIENYALIEKLDISFDKGLSIITGETGAGKSILLGALGLILGQRADTAILFDKNKKCIIEGTFDIEYLNLANLFNENDLDYDNIVIFRREITPQGKSRAFINDTPVTLNTLKVITEQLIDIHSQHQNLVLAHSAFRYYVVDSFAGITSDVQQYKHKYTELTGLRKQIDQLMQSEKQTHSDLDYYKFQYDELTSAALDAKEFDEVRDELEILNHSTDIKYNLEKARYILENAPENLIAKLLELNATFRALSKYSQQFAEPLSRLNTIEIDIKDILQVILRLNGEIIDDPQRAALLQQRFDKMQRLMLKHNAPDIQTLIDIRDEYQKKINSHESLGVTIETLNKEYTQKEKELSEKAQKISESRKSAAKKFENEILILLKGLGIPNGKFKAEVQNSNQPNLYGCDQLMFLFNANVGGELQELSRVASGGELSRLMLAIKSVISLKNLLPTIVFDEIDTGLSGEIGFKMAAILERISSNMQVICITHLPQIAAKGDNHFVVYKKVENKQTQTKVKKIEGQERLEEIAKILGGENPSETVFEAAKELIKQSSIKN